MARTTLDLKDDFYKKLEHLAEAENRSTPNLIETILIKYLDEMNYADDFEMESIQRDSSLKQSITKGIADYKTKRGRFV